MKDAGKEIVPSLLSADFSQLEWEIREVEEAGASRLHLDVMDGHFVPNLTFGPIIIEAIRKLTTLHLETHLMITNPEKYYLDFINAGSDTVIVHLETSEPGEVLEAIRSRRVPAGLSLNPETPIDSLSEELIPLIDHFLVMTVHPGFGGQQMIKKALEKTVLFSRMKGEKTVVEIDGGVNRDTLRYCRKFPVDLYVAGSAIFSEDKPGRAFRELTQVLEKND